MISHAISRLGAGLCGLLIAAGGVAGDWQPSTAPAVSGSGAAGSSPGQPMSPVGPPLPFDPMSARFPPGFAPPQGGFGPPDAAGAVEYDPDTGQTVFEFVGLGLTQSRTDDTYLLDIDLRGLPAEQVQVRPAGGGLVLVVRRVSETSREETLGEGRGYRRSWGYSSGQSVKRLPTPPDADVLAMQREDSADAVRISIPRQADLSGYGTESAPGRATTPPLPEGYRP